MIYSYWLHVILSSHMDDFHVSQMLTYIIIPSLSLSPKLFVLETHSPTCCHEHQVQCQHSYCMQSQRILVIKMVLKSYLIERKKKVIFNTILILLIWVLVLVNLIYYFVVGPQITKCLLVLNFHTLPLLFVL